MGLTPNHAIPYPDLDEPADIPLDLKEAVDRIDGVMAIVPTGAILATAGTTSPTGFLPCDGGAVPLGTALSDMLIAAGNPFGVSGSQAKTPDLRGRTPFGRDVGQAEFNTLGETGGEKTHQLLIGELPTHSHPSPSGVQGYVTGAANAAGAPSGAGDRAGPTAGTPVFNNTGNIGNGTAHQNLPPYMALNWIIKT